MDQQSRELKSRDLYFVSVLQIPTPRYNLFDTIALDVDPKDSGTQRRYKNPHAVHRFGIYLND